MSYIKSRYWLCSLEGHPRPLDAPLKIDTLEYLCWKHTETKLDLFVIFHKSRPFPLVSLKKYNPQATPTTLADYLDNPFPKESASHGKLPQCLLLPRKKIDKHNSKNSQHKRKPREARATSDNPLVYVEKNIHYDCITGVTTPLGFTYGQWPPLNDSNQK